MDSVRTQNTAIWLVDDDDSVRQGVSALLEAAGFEVRSFSDGRALLAALAAENPAPAALLVDVYMPEVDGLELLERVKERAPHLPLVLMSAYGTVPMVTRLMREGAADFLEKPFSRDTLFGALNRVLNRSGQTGAVRPQPPGWIDALSPREQDVLGYMIEGEPNKMIARHLGISVRTVEVHRSRILQKTGARNLAELIHKAGGFRPARDGTKH